MDLLGIAAVGMIGRTLAARVRPPSPSAAWTVAMLIVDVMIETMAARCTMTSGRPAIVQTNMGI